MTRSPDYAYAPPYRCHDWPAQSVSARAVELSRNALSFLYFSCGRYAAQNVSAGITV